MVAQVFGSISHRSVWPRFKGSFSTTCLPLTVRENTAFHVPTLVSVVLADHARPGKGEQTGGGRGDKRNEEEGREEDRKEEEK